MEGEASSHWSAGQVSSPADRIYGSLRGISSTCWRRSALLIEVERSLRRTTAAVFLAETERIPHQPIIGLVANAKALTAAKASLA